MISVEDKLHFEEIVYKNLKKYLIKKYYRSFGRLKEIFEVFGEQKYKIFHDEGSYTFVVIFSVSNKKLQFTCKDVEKKLSASSLDLNNLSEEEIQSAVYAICDERL